MKALTPFKRFRGLMKAEKETIGRVYSYAVFQGLVNLSIPLGIQAIVNLIQGGQVSASWIILVIVVVLGVILTGVLQLYQLRLMENLQQKIFTGAALDFTYRLPKFNEEAMEKNSAPELMNRFFDVMSVQKGLSKVLIDFSAAILQVLFGLVLLSFYHPFFILFGFFLVIMLISIFRITGKKGLETSLKESKYKYKLASWLEDIAGTRLSFKMAASSTMHIERSDEYISSYLNSRESHFKVLKQQYSLLIAFKAVIAAALLLIGGLLVLNQQMNIGQFIAAEIIILLVINSVEKLILNAENIYDVLTALEKIGHVTDIEIDSGMGGSQSLTSNGKGLEVELKNMGFAFKESGFRLFDNFNLKIESGEKVCLFGETGSGKSTLLLLLSGMYRDYAGSICYNGLPAGNFQEEDLRNHTGARFMSDNLFPGSVFDNIVMGRPGIDIQKVRAIASEIGLDRIVAGYQDGYDTWIGHDYKKISKSVTQKILLARCIVHEPSLLLIENGMEFLSAPDRKMIMQYLTSSERPWTLIMTSEYDDVKSQCMRNIEIETLKLNNHH